MKIERRESVYIGRAEIKQSFCIRANYLVEAAGTCVFPRLGKIFEDREEKSREKREESGNRERWIKKV